MPAPILATKLYLPPLRVKFVPRPRLVQRLDEGLAAGHKLTLLSASAGFGKTTLLSEWIAGSQQPSAWLSLDEGDSDPARFLTYLIAALQGLALSSAEGPALSNTDGIAPHTGAAALAALQSPQPPPVELILTSLLNEIAALTDSFILVLDDYHLIDSQAVDQMLAFLVEHLPPQMHLVIASREDPHLPLARLRARGQLTELRLADLRFTPREAAEFLNQVMGLQLPAEQIAALEARTEGWIAGLQLAALSMQGGKDAAAFIQSFTGSHRFVLDYLAGEVLAIQPERVRSFLLQTSILDRLSGPLCDAVTGQDGGKGLLEALERGNLFVVSLDDQRQWYRYHHLFADVLQAHLVEAQPEQVAVLHRRASAWYEHSGFPPDAIRHALAARDFERAAGLIELAWSAMDLSYQASTWLGWVKALPQNLLHNRPVLSLGYGWALLDVGEVEASEAHMLEAEAALDLPADQIVVVDAIQFRSLPASIATGRAYHSLALGDLPAAEKHAQRALELTPQDDQVRYTQAVSLLGVAQYASGELLAAERSLEDFLAHLRHTGNIRTLIGITFLLADIRVALGRLHEAERSYRHTLSLAVRPGEPPPQGTADLYRGLAELFIERNDLDAAARHLKTGQKLGEQAATTDWRHRLCVSQARLKEAQGDLDEALALLDEAARVYVRGALPDVRPVAALKARLLLRQGRLAEALAWVREQALSLDDELPFRREFEHITLARVLIADGISNPESVSLDQAARLLGRLLQAAEAGGRLGSVIQILLLQALVFQEQGSLPGALAALERAVTLAEPQGYVRIFVDEGEDMRWLLEKLARQPGHPLGGYSARLLAAFPQPEASSKPDNLAQQTGLLEPLSERELEVLKLLRSELSGPEIAERLVISLNTLRSHTKNIYRKLGVSSRRTAIRRAEQLALL